MLLRFGVENHLSVRERQELLLTASKRVKRSGTVVSLPVLREAALPVAVLYGANASGKSNLVHAVRMMRDHIVMSHKSRDATDGIPHRPFLLDDASANEPTQFDCLFTVDDDDGNAPQSVYEYGFSFTNDEYIEEWLHRIVRGKRQTKQMLFSRTTKDGVVEVAFGGRLRGANSAIAALTRPNSLFLSAAAQNNHPQLGAIHRQFVERWAPVRFPDAEARLAEAFADFEQKGAFVGLVRQAGLGVVGTKLDHEVPEAERDKLREFHRAYANLTRAASDADEPPSSWKQFRFTHASDGGERPLDYGLESRGTQRLAALAIPILNAVSAGQLVIVDELDTSLHHRLTAALLRFFKSSANQRGAQLLTTVHDTSLLREELDLDEVWLAEKDHHGVSRFTPLTDYRVRSREDLERVYREGRVGAAPVVGDFTAAL